MCWNSVQPAKQERMFFSPNWTWHIWFSCRQRFSGRDVFCAKCHQNWVKDYLQGVQLFTTRNTRAYHIRTAPADWYHKRRTRCPMAFDFAFNILVSMNRGGSGPMFGFQTSGSTFIIKVTAATAPWIKCLFGKLQHKANKGKRRIVHERGMYVGPLNQSLTISLLFL